MKKKEYMKPEQRIVELRHRTMILAGSITSVNSGDTGITIDDDEPVGDGFWGR